MKKQLLKGFTLVELILVTGLMSILISILGSVFGDILEMKSRSERNSAVSQDVRYLTSRFLYDISRASDISTPSPGDDSAVLTLTVGGSPYTYSLANGILSVNSGGVTTALNSPWTKISNLNFSRSADQGGKSVVTFTAEVSPEEGTGSPDARAIHISGRLR